MLMLATVKKKKKGSDFLSIFGACEFFFQNEWEICVLVGAFGRMAYLERYLIAGMELNEDCRAECWTRHTSRLSLFFAQTPSQGDQILVCNSANCPYMGRVIVCGDISHFLERKIITWLNFYRKKSIFKNIMQKKKIL